MKFIKETTENEFFESLSKNMNKYASYEDNLINDQKSQALEFLSEAATKLKEAGLSKNAQQVAVIEKVVRDDADPEHYVQNLLQNGMMQDLTCVDDKPDAQNSDDNSDQLSPEEVQALRKLLKVEEKEHQATEEASEDDNDVKAVMKTPSGSEVGLDMTPEETKQVLS